MLPEQYRCFWLCDSLKETNDWKYWRSTSSTWRSTFLIQALRKRLLWLYGLQCEGCLFDVYSEIYFAFIHCLQDILREGDTDHDGELNFEEFARYLQERERKLLLMFHSLDRNRDGTKFYLPPHCSSLSSCQSLEQCQCFFTFLPIHFVPNTWYHWTIYVPQPKWYVRQPWASPVPSLSIPLLNNSSSLDWLIITLFALFWLPQPAGQLQSNFYPSPLCPCLNEKLLLPPVSMLWFSKPHHQLYVVFTSLDIP